MEYGLVWLVGILFDWELLLFLFGVALRAKPMLLLESSCMEVAYQTGAIKLRPMHSSAISLMHPI